MATRYRNEIIHKAAINWWWDQLAKLQKKHSITVGTSSQNVGEQWQRAYQMIEFLEKGYEETRVLGFDINVDNLSRFSKQTLRRIGGVKEEDTFTFFQNQ